jgi:MFS family permease
VTTTTSLSPLKYRLFRAIWIASLIANIGFWMQNVGAAWLMTSLSDSSIMVALTQTAISLPAFFFGMPAGVLADLLNKRRLLLLIHAWSLFASLLLVLFFQLDVVGPWTLLCLVFLSGIGSALSLPVWQASISDVVPVDALLPAIALNSVAYNAARAVGPAIAGIIIASLGVGAVFALNACMLMVALCIFVCFYTPPFSGSSSDESLRCAIQAGIRFMRYERPLHGYLIRAIAFVFSGSALWALLPLSAKMVTGAGASSYGYLLASLGFGAVLGGLLLGRIRQLFDTLDALLLGATLLFAAALFAAAWVPSLLLLCLMLIAGGLAWVAFSSPLNAAFQSALPRWVRARAISVFLLAFQGAMALGGAFWGIVASLLGVAEALSLAGLCMVLGLSLTRRYSMEMKK